MTPMHGNNLPLCDMYAWNYLPNINTNTLMRGIISLLCYLYNILCELDLCTIYASQKNCAIKLSRLLL